MYMCILYIYIKHVYAFTCLEFRVVFKIFNNYYSMDTDHSEYMIDLWWEEGPGGPGVP